MNDDESPDPAAPEPLEPTAAAALINAVSGDETMRSRAAVLVEEQIRLSQLQREHLHTQHIRDRFLVAFDLALAIAGVILIAIAATLFWDAWSSRSVIIDPFDVPASLASQGRTGKAVASELLDRLKAYQFATRSSQAKRSVQDAWSNQILIQIPEAGISIADLQNLLHRWLGHDEHVSGSVILDGQNLALTIRGEGFPAKTFRGGVSRLENLVTKAAEYAYGSSEPYLFAVYLSDQGRDAEAIALVKSAFPGAPASDRPLLLNLWANALDDLGRFSEAKEKILEALRAEPRFWLAYDSLMGIETSLAEEEDVVRTGREMERLARRGGWFGAGVPAVYWENLDYRLADWPAFERDIAEDLEQNGGHGTEAAEEAPVHAEALAHMHDWRRAELEVETSPGSESDSFVIAESALVRGIVAIDKRDFTNAATDLKIGDEIASKSPSVAGNLETSIACWRGLADGLSGNEQAARADFVRGGHFVDCYRFAGDLDDAKGNWNRAEKDYAAAAALAPSMPSPYQSWGRALAAHHQFDSAIVKFAVANKRGPHWADPLERWGETLMRMNRSDLAVAKFREADKYAPNWGRLHLKWGEASIYAGHAQQGRAQLNIASKLDLSDADRAELAKMQVRRD